MSKTKSHFDNIAHDYDQYAEKKPLYYGTLNSLLKSIIPKNKMILEIGCGTGDLISKLDPKVGYGIDMSEEMIRIAKRKFKNRKNLHFSTKELLAFRRKKLDYVFMSDVIEHLEKPRKMFSDLSKVMDKQTTFINTMANPKWESVLMIGEKLKYKMPEGKHNRISFAEIEVIMKNVDLVVIKHDFKLLIPVEIPLITNLANKYFEKHLKNYAFIEYFTAKKI